MGTGKEYAPAGGVTLALPPWAMTHHLAHQACHRGLLGTQRPQPSPHWLTHTMLPRKLMQSTSAEAPEAYAHM